ncbi:MAG TPA: signal peptide peptidase SppA [Burkholderiales bacterium]|jgi:protease-4|nr:signal peptide peptidase SppA [Burkholderiales bacterium]
MAEQKHGIIARLFIGLWNLLNFTRRLVFNVIFLLLLIGFIAALRSGGPKLAERTALVLDPKGSIVEQYTTEPVQRAFSSMFGDKVKQVQLRDILRAIDSAAADKRIERIVLNPDDIESAGLSTLREIGAALERFKATGKQVIAVSDGMDQRQYYLAAHANQILLHPDSLEGVLLSGFGAYRSYFKDALDWLGVDVHLFRVGEYKSYAEPYIRNDQSPEAREADLYWMNGLWAGYLKDVAESRHLDAHKLAELINHYADAVKAAGGDMAKLALASKLVDQLATPDEARELLIAQGVKQGHSFRHVDFQDYARLTERESALDLRPRIAVVVAEGEILGGDQPPGTVGGESTAKLLREAREDEKNKAIVLRVNSPGGDAFASELIRREVELTKAAHKPLLVSMGDVAASGGYWISMNGDKIFAEPTTITGSIGIFGLMMNIPNTLAKIGVHTDGVGTTPIADALDPRRPLDPKVGDVIQSLINKGYQDFIGKVSAARGKTTAEIDAIARGRVWSGEQALERGLVDELGGLGDALTAAAQAANLGANFRVHYVEKPLSAWERFALSFSNDALAHFAKTLLPEMPTSLLAQPDVRSQLRLLQSLGRGRPGVFAYCFCEMR